MDLSVVIPVFDEQDNVARLYELIAAALDDAGWSYQVIFVDDGSRDDTANRLRTLHEKHGVHVLRFHRNAGQTAAMRAGIEFATGDTIVTMDGDLQNDPSDIPKLVNKLHEGFDLVVGWRRDRKDSMLIRTFPSRVANWLIRKVTNVPVHDTGCSLKAYRASMIKQVPLYSEMHRFIPAISSTAGARITEVEVKHHARSAGCSKYGLSRIGKVLLDVLAIKMLITFSWRPMHWFSMAAIPFFLLWMVSLFAYIGVWLLTDFQTPGIVALTLVVIFFYLFAHFMFLGLLSELLIRTNLNRASAASRRIVRRS
ncbi:MAG: glycosyltransferase family 2 protein [Planctomycetales bacterium]|nr:glycosyltransferase family 2 protein [Planctomycetales bacterium]